MFLSDQTRCGGPSFIDVYRKRQWDNPTRNPMDGRH